MYIHTFHCICIYILYGCRGNVKCASWPISWLEEYYADIGHNIYIEMGAMNNKIIALFEIMK